MLKEFEESDVKFPKKFEDYEKMLKVLKNEGEKGFIK